MNIVINVNTVFDFEAFIVPWIQQNFAMDPVRLNTDRFAEMYDLSEEMEARIRPAMEAAFLLRAKPQEGAVEFITALKQRNHHVALFAACEDEQVKQQITAKAQSFGLGEVKFYPNCFWLAKHAGSVNVYLDRQQDYLRKLAESGIDIVCMAHAYARLNSHPRIRMMHGWYWAYSEITRMATVRDCMTTEVSQETPDVAIGRLENIAIDLTGRLAACKENPEKAELLTNYLKAIDLAQNALCSVCRDKKGE